MSAEIMPANMTMALADNPSKIGQDTNTIQRVPAREGTSISSWVNCWMKTIGQFGRSEWNVPYASMELKIMHTAISNVQRMLSKWITEAITIIMPSSLSSTTSLWMKCYMLVSTRQWLNCGRALKLCMRWRVTRWLLASWETYFAL